MGPEVESFPALSRTDARVLILGSMPGIASLRAQQYYAHPRNAFWVIMDELLATEPDPDTSYSARTERLLDSGIALWDVLRYCQREGSLDSSIVKDSEEVNDFASFFRSHREIRLVMFNGARAEESFHRHAGDLPSGVRAVRMPSTSPAHAAMALAQKLAAWREGLGGFLS